MKILLSLTFLVLSSCAHEPPRGFILPPALSEVFRQGQLKGLESNRDGNLGIPNQSAMVSHTCRSQPIWDLQGRYVRTDVSCY